MENQNKKEVEKIKECSEKVNKILEAYGFILEARVMLSNGRCDAKVILLPKPKEEEVKNE